MRCACNTKPVQINQQAITLHLTPPPQVYGMSECCGATTISTDPAHRWGSIGFSMAGCETRVFRVADGSPGKLMESTPAKTGGHLTEEEQGEICFRRVEPLIRAYPKP